MSRGGDSGLLDFTIGSCTGVNFSKVNFWALFSSFEAQAARFIADPVIDNASEMDRTPSESSSVRSRTPRMNSDCNMEALANKWNAFSEGPLTKRLQSIEDYNKYEREWTDGYVDAAFSSPEDLENRFKQWEHDQANVLHRMPTFDESWNWLEQMSARSQQSRDSSCLVNPAHC